MIKRNPERTKARLLRSGAALFDAKEYRNVSILAIAQAAGCNSALISYYFGGKAALYQAVVKEECQELSRLQEEVEAAGGTPLERLTRYLQEILRSQLEPQKHVNILYRELINPSGVLDNQLWDHLKAISSYLQSLLHQAQEAGQIQPPQEARDYAYAAFLLEAISELLFLLKEHTLPFNPEGKSPEQLLEDLVHFALRTVKKGSS